MSGSTMPSMQQTQQKQMGGGRGFGGSPMKGGAPSYDGSSLASEKAALPSITNPPKQQKVCFILKCFFFFILKQHTRWKDQHSSKKKHKKLLDYLKHGGGL